MGTHTVWLVPHQQQVCVSGLWEIAERLWSEGFCPYLDLTETWGVGGPAKGKGSDRPYDYFAKRESELKNAGATLPKRVSGPFDSTWISCRPYKFLVPTHSDTLEFYCPRCQNKISPDHSSTAGNSFSFTYGAFISCPSCHNDYPATELVSDLGMSAWVQFCISFEDYVFDEPTDEWEAAIERVIGPFFRFVSWHS